MTAGRETGGLSAEERKSLTSAFEEFRSGRFTTSATMFAAVERILATRAAQPDAGTALDEVERRAIDAPGICYCPPMGPHYESCAELNFRRIIAEVRAAHGQDESGEG